LTKELKVLGILKIFNYQVNNSRMIKDKIRKEDMVFYGEIGDR
jgi:hypothetical protein